MQKRHQNRRSYFNESANSSRDYYIGYVSRYIPLGPDTRVLEIGCGEGGNLLPFAEQGCTVTGIDIQQAQIENAKKFFADAGREGTFIYSDFLEVPTPTAEADRYDVILIHDVIEHIEWPYKDDFFNRMAAFLKAGGVAFFAFPAWQMPFGGHQQVTHGFASKIPWIHLLPTSAYRWLLRRSGETPHSVDGMMSIRNSRMPVERFESLCKRNGFRIRKRILWLINPHYKQKFHLNPIRLVVPFDRLRWLRNFYTTSAFYIVGRPQQAAQ